MGSIRQEHLEKFGGEETAQTEQAEDQLEEFGIDNQLDLRYCKLDEINKRKARSIVIIGQFYIKMNHLKSLGQKLEVMHRIGEFIEENIDLFWGNLEVRTRFLENQKKSKDIHSLIASKNAYHQKQRLVNALMDYAEEIQIRRRRKIREKRIDNLRKNTSMKLDFRMKDQYLQSAIENDINFFDCRVSTG